MPEGHTSGLILQEITHFDSWEGSEVQERWYIKLSKRRDAFYAHGYLLAFKVVFYEVYRSCSQGLSLNIGG